MTASAVVQGEAFLMASCGYDFHVHTMPQHVCGTHSGIFIPMASKNWGYVQFPPHL